MANKPNIRFKGFTEDWEQRKLGDVCKRVTRKNKNNESDLPLTIASQYGLIDQRDFFNKVVAAKDMSNYYLLKKGEFAYNKSYSKGFDYGSITRLDAYEQGCLSTLYICFGITSDDVESDYLECFFDTLKWYSDITMICAEGARNHGLLNVDTKAFFDEVTISMPSLKKEQRIISAYLNNLDHLITLHQRKCDDTKKLKKYMLQKMFPKNGEKKPEIRFAGFTDDWEQRKFSELYEKNVEKNTELIGYDKTISIATMTYKDEGNGASDESLKTYKVLRTGDLAFEGHTNKDFRYGRFVANDIGTGIMSPRFSTLRPVKDMPVSFWKYYIHYEPIMRSVLVNSTKAGTMMNELVVADFMKQSIRVPSIGEQEKIGEYFSTLDHLITLHQRKCDDLKNLKKYMLQNMFV